MGIRILYFLFFAYTSCTSVTTRIPSSRPKEYPQLQLEKNSTYCGIVRSVDRSSGWVQIDVGVELNRPRMIQVNDKTSREAEKVLEDINRRGVHEKDYLLCEYQSATFERTWEIKFNSQILYSCKGFNEQQIEAKKVDPKVAATDVSAETLKQRIEEGKVYHIFSIRPTSFVQIEKKWDGQLLARILNTNEKLIPLTLTENEEIDVYQRSEESPQFELFFSKESSKWPSDEKTNLASRRILDFNLPKPPDCDELCQDNLAAKTEIKGRSWLEFIPDRKPRFGRKKENDAQSTRGFFICKKPSGK